MERSVPFKEFLILPKGKGLHPATQGYMESTGIGQEAGGSISHSFYWGFRLVGLYMRRIPLVNPLHSQEQDSLGVVSPWPANFLRCQNIQKL